MKNAFDPANIFDVDEHTFSAKVLEASHCRPILVDFWADWCGPCLMLSPVLEKVIHEQAGKIALAKLEVDDNMRVAGRYRVRGFPTVIAFFRGEEVGRFTGAQPAHVIRDFLGAHCQPVLGQSTD